METKTIMTGFFALFLMLFSFSFALAENETSNLSDEAVPMLISAPIEDSVLNETEVVTETEAAGNIFWKRADIWFTFNQEKKAEKELKLAELQLVRARIAAKNNNTKAMVGALEAHQKLIEKVQARVSKFEEKSTERELRNSTDKLVGLDSAIEAHEARIARFTASLANSNLSAEEVANIQKRIEQAQNNTAHLRNVADAKKERIELKLRAMNTTEPVREKIRERVRNSSFDENESEDESEDLDDDSNESEDSSDDSEDDASEAGLSGSGQSGNGNK